MDKIKDSGSFDASSILAGTSKKKRMVTPVSYHSFYIVREISL